MPVSSLTVPTIEPLKSVSVKAPATPAPMIAPEPAAAVAATVGPEVAPAPGSIIQPPASVGTAADVPPVAARSAVLTEPAAGPVERIPRVIDTEGASPPSAPTDAAAAILGQFTAMDGVQWAVLSDREGFLVEATRNAGVDAEVAAALSACLAESSDGLGKELGRGPLQSIILEYEKGMVVVYSAGAGGLLAVGLTEPAVLGKVRYFAKKALPELTRSL
jgi:predicted regulator of Ras-like GTPase activity (Roadblock/LC7/MglB family)